MNKLTVTTPVLSEVIQGYYSSQVRDEAGNPIATAYGRTDDECNRNGRAIITQPLLVEALADMVEAARGSFQDPDNTSLRKARKALASLDPAVKGWQDIA